MTERGAIEQAEEHAEKYAKLRTRLSVREIRDEIARESADFLTDDVIDEANFWADDYELREGYKPGDIVKRRYVRRGKNIEMENVEDIPDINPFLRGRR